MLIFATNIKRERPCAGVSGGAGHVIEAFLVWSAEVIDDRLTEVVAMGQRRTRDTGDTSVDRFDFSAETVRPLVQLVRDELTKCQ